MNKTIKTALVGALLLLATDAFAQAWPNKPIKLAAPYPPGGQTDVVSRYFADKLTGVLGQQIIVENKAGAQGMVGAEIVKNAAADGYTFLYVNSSMMCINPYVYKKLPYDGLQGLRAGDAARPGAACHGNAAVARAEVRQGVRRLGARAQGQSQLRLVRHRLLLAHLGRDAESGGKARHDARAVQGRRTGGSKTPWPATSR